MRSVRIDWMANCDAIYLIYECYRYIYWVLLTLVIKITITYYVGLTHKKGDMVNKIWHP